MQLSDKYNYFQVCGQDVRPTNKVVGHSLLHMFMPSGLCLCMHNIV